MNAEIRNCEFRFKCPRTWESLSKTFDQRVRHCSECDRRVIYCKTESELKRAIIYDECVAVEIVQPGGGVQLFVGEPSVDQILDDPADEVSNTRSG